MTTVRTYGSPPYAAAVLHGGPGAGGEMAPVARELSASVGVLEPLHTEASIEGQIRALYCVLGVNADAPVALIGWSWGAWLGFIFAARHPSMVRTLVLVGSGPFEERYAADIMKTRLGRLTDEERHEAQSLLARLGDPGTANKDRLLAEFGALISRADSFDPVSVDTEPVSVRYDVFRSVWTEAEELRRSGELLRFGTSIRCPVIAIHGDYDPHPHEGVRAPLESVLKDFRFILLERCGHTPWLERCARGRFHEILKKALSH
jgi:pimeloyl-ACP methyl ester carboxylesterase